MADAAGQLATAGSPHLLQEGGLWFTAELQPAGCSVLNGPSQVDAIVLIRKTFNILIIQKYG